MFRPVNNFQVLTSQIANFSFLVEITSQNNVLVQANRGRMYRRTSAGKSTYDSSVCRVVESSSFHRIIVGQAEYIEL